MSDRAAAVTKLVLAVFRAHQALVNEGDRRVAGVGLNSARWKVLGAIALADTALTAADIGRHMGLSRQGAQKQLDALTDEALVARADNPAHRRAPTYHLTEAGRTAYLRADAIWSEWSRSLGEGLDPDRCLDAAALLDALVGPS